jgi:hypothetical protein
LAMANSNWKWSHVCSSTVNQNDYSWELVESKKKEKMKSEKVWNFQFTTLFLSLARNWSLWARNFRITLRNFHMLCYVNMFRIDRMM